MCAVHADQRDNNGNRHAGGAARELTPPFVVFSLPRSRSKWLSAFLGYGDWQCGHDEIRHMRSLEDVKSWLGQPCTGSVETAAAPFWRLLLHYRPDARVVTVRRPVEEVCQSLANIFPIDPVRMRFILNRLDRKLDQIEARTDAIRFEYHDLADEDVCATLFEYLLPYDHDPEWWRQLSAINLQVNLWHIARYMQAHTPQLEKLSQQAKHRMASLFERKTELDGVTFQCEAFPKFYADAEPLIREHLVQTDQSPDAIVNLELFNVLDQLGCLQVMTARSNGRMFGYLLSVIGPALDTNDKLVALHTAFFASPLFRGLGMKLQRAALETLKQRGISEVQMRAGVRGSGPRLGTFYRRLGAEGHGELYRLSLEE